MIWRKVGVFIFALWALHQFHHQFHCHLIQLHEFQQHQQYWQVDLNCHQNQCHHRQPLHQRHMDHLWQQNNMLTFSIFNIFNCLCQSIKQISFHLLFSFYNFIYYSKINELCSDAPFSVSKTWIIQRSITYCNNKIIHTFKKYFR